VRLTQEEARIIREIVNAVMPGVEVYLYGSRVDDAKRGGDIDLLLMGRQEKSPERISRIRILLHEKLGDQKIDIVYHQEGKEDPFIEYISEEAIKL